MTLMSAWERASMEEMACHPISNSGLSRELPTWVDKVGIRTWNGRRQLQSTLDVRGPVTPSQSCISISIETTRTVVFESSTMCRPPSVDECASEDLAKS